MNSSTTTQRWPDPLTGPYWLALTVADVGEYVEVVGVELWGTPPAWVQPHDLVSPTTPITGATLRQIPLATLGRALADRWRRTYRIIFAGSSPLGQPFPEPLQAESQRLADLLESHRGRPRLYGDDHWRAVAHRYRVAAGAGQPTTAAVAEGFSVSHATAKEWVRTARRRGFLDAPL